MIKKAYRYFIRRITSFFVSKHVKADSEVASLSNEIIEEYNSTRFAGNRKYLCYAPFKNIYFNIQGDAAPCWLTFKDPDSYPDKNIHDIWFGKKFEDLRENIRNYDLSGKCSVCNHYINSRNYVTPLAKAYDNDYSDRSYPVMMELELANTCNLECVMCNGKLSSSIRKNREKLDPYPIPYDDNFIHQLEEFLPHLEEARFNGGEPFLNDIYYRIWEKIIEVKPSMKVVIATNGTVMNERVKDLLERGRFDINLSCDSLNKETYHGIRVNAIFEKTMENIQWFHGYCKRKNTTLCILTNPLRENWKEMPAFIDFCNERNLPIWFNTIHRPYEHALWTLDSGTLQEIFETLSGFEFNTNPLKPQTFHNKKVYNNLVHNQIKTWLEEARERESQNITPVEKKEELKEIPEDPRQYFYDSFNQYIFSLDGSEEFRKNKAEVLLQKFELIRRIVVQEMPENDFFTKLIKAPIGDIVEDIENEPVEKLASRAKFL